MNFRGVRTYSNAIMSLFEDVFILILFSGEFMVIFVVLFLGGK